MNAAGRLATANVWMDPCEPLTLAGFALDDFRRSKGDEEEIDLDPSGTIRDGAFHRRLSVCAQRL